MMDVDERSSTSTSSSSSTLLNQQQHCCQHYNDINDDDDTVNIPPTTTTFYCSSDDDNDPSTATSFPVINCHSCRTERQFGRSRSRKSKMDRMCSSSSSHEEDDDNNEEDCSGRTTTRRRKRRWNSWTMMGILVLFIMSCYVTDLAGASQAEDENYVCFKGIQKNSMGSK